MGDERVEAGAVASPPRAAAPSTKRRSNPWPFALIALFAVAVAAMLLDRAIAPPPPPAIAPLPEARPMILPLPGGDSGAPPLAPALRHGTGDAQSAAPALSRAAREEAAAAPHPMPEQLRAARKIAETRRIEVARQQRELPPPPPTPALSPRLAASGHVIQLGAYDSAREAEAAAKIFRYRYRGLLETLPKAVSPSKAAGSEKYYYRVQFIAPAQANAEIICQRLRVVRQKCIVIY